MEKKHLSQIHAVLGQGNAITMMELQPELYFEANCASLECLVGKGESGVYLSFHRPAQNLSTFFEGRGIDTSKIIFIDGATQISKEFDQENSIVNIDDLVHQIYRALSEIQEKKKFIFIDSLTTIALYQPLSEVLRFSDFLTRTIEERDEEIHLILNVATDLTQKRFIRHIALAVDEVVRVEQ